MSNWIIVAIPDAQEPVWKFSSEKVPHMTLLHLGEQNLDADLPRIVQYIAHVASTVMDPFGMMVDRRGTLGDKKADVLLFEKDKSNKRTIDLVRNYLLQDPGILKMYSSAEQYPEWTPHLTMGYPEKPAKKDDREYPHYSYISFDRIALWIGDCEGPEFRLEGRDNRVTPMDGDLTMSVDIGAFLEHFGVKGMRWGRRKSDVADGETLVTQRRPGAKLFAEGGRNVPASADAVKAASSRQRAKASTTDALSTKELQELVTRMNLEQQYSKLSAASVSPGRKFANELLVRTVKQQATDVISNQANTLLKAQLKKAGVA